MCGAKTCSSILGNFFFSQKKKKKIRQCRVKYGPTVTP